MIRSKNKVSLSLINTSDVDYIYVNSELIKRNEDYLVVTRYFKRVIVRPAVEASEGIDAVEEAWNYNEISSTATIYTIEQIDTMFEAVRPYVGSLFYTAMVERGVEISLLNFLNTNARYGIPANSNGWEIMQ